ncbi:MULTISPECIES: hypothetical protein [unclassified Microcoleus]|uniref:hypothetical protein n=1 Tax=unclassified Microcoleus TaxID=2642155 RepID=UPI002FD0FDE2
MKSSTREGGFCLCSCGFQPPGFFGFQLVFCGWAIGFFVDVRSDFWWICDRILVDGGDRVFC